MNVLMLNMGFVTALALLIDIEGGRLIRFGADGKFTYYCACGNPVNNSDLCEGYTYDDSTKTISLNCIETTDEMVTTIKIVKCDENSLHLDFDGEIRIFEK